MTTTFASLRSLARFTTLGLVGLAGPLLGCGDPASHTIGIIGDSAVRDGLAAAAFVDGWSVQFDQFVVVVHDPALIEHTEGEDAAWVRRVGVTVWDVVADPELGVQRFEIETAGLRAASYDGFDFRIGPPSVSGDPAQSGNVEAEVVDAMIESDTAIRVVGTATNGGSTIAFDWSFSTDTIYRCAIDVELEPAQEGSSVIEILGGRLFGNELGDATPTYEFDAIASADADADGIVTLEELDAVSLAGFASYDVGDEDVEDLGGFVRALSRGIGSVVGDDGCEVIDP